MFHPEMNTLSSFTHANVIPNPNDCLYSDERKRRESEDGAGRIFPANYNDTYSFPAKKFFSVISVSFGPRIKLLEYSESYEPSDNHFM